MVMPWMPTISKKLMVAICAKANRARSSTIGTVLAAVSGMLSPTIAANSGMAGEW